MTKEEEKEHNKKMVNHVSDMISNLSEDKMPLEMIPLAIFTAAQGFSAVTDIPINNLLEQLLRIAKQAETMNNDGVPIEGELEEEKPLLPPAPTNYQGIKLHTDTSIVSGEASTNIVNKDGVEILPKGKPEDYLKQKPNTQN